MTRLIAITALFLSFFTASSSAYAQYFPGYDDTYVNDIADLLTDETEETLRRKLNYLKEDIGTEMTVLTINDMATYGDWDNIAEFGTALFNEWGIGNAERNDGLLLLISKNDRELRIAIGSGYAPIYDDISEDIIQFYITPAFKDGDFDDGVLDGAQKMIELISLQHNSGTDPPERPSNPNSSTPWILWGMGIFFSGAIGASIIGPRYARYKFSKKPCPQCGAPGMKKTLKTITVATRSTMGKRETTIDCPNCEYHNVVNSKISCLSARNNNSSGSGSSGFGGGSSSGGGASGKW